MTDNETRKTWIIVTGLSGSGKSVALNTLEDLGFHCMDNLPPAIVVSLLEHMGSGDSTDFDRVALGLDIRTAAENDLGALIDLLPNIRRHVSNCRVLFFTASDDELVRRYSETRRKHPLADARTGLSRALIEERRLMASILEMADQTFDTSDLSIHQLRRQVREAAGVSEQPLTLLLESFAFKQGVPPDVDIAFDARVLPNPHWQLDLRPLTGRSEPVRQYLEAQELVNRFVDDLYGWITRWLPHYEADSRNYLTIGVGCTGGKHRSVYVVETLAKRLEEIRDPVLVYHRELL